MLKRRQMNVFPDESPRIVAVRQDFLTPSAMIDVAHQENVMQPPMTTVDLAPFTTILLALAADSHTVKFGHATETTVAGESLDVFVARIAPRARAASESTRSVLCSQIAGEY
ncbi:hypothetical protein XEUV354_21805 [Xanthomonas euvesicatoria]|nr:hypothetical protein [Xanthomonas euvesicatoria]OHX23514.1 hypothetical protein BHL63_21330 [Xanthomonas alfalfae]TKA18118.1 hypothetical protein TP41_10440 [Xanthomonas euvesicatoria pv. citrumelonis]AOY65460.1 hypothetical protein BHE83_01985 [Xanthomonas euvesicatoria pv. vesicatoria str. 85-10]APO90864.1 hypothetical protein BJD11_13165 [Xanthomonas euvesicatoria]KHL60495.1 hypothetical protein XEU66b_15920 [Xanthomonas euvesicatoria]